MSRNFHLHNSLSYAGNFSCTINRHAILKKIKSVGFDGIWTWALLISTPTLYQLRHWEPTWNFAYYECFKEHNKHVQHAWKFSWKKKKKPIHVSEKFFWLRMANCDTYIAGVCTLRFDLTCNTWEFQATKCWAVQGFCKILISIHGQVFSISF